MRRIGWASLGAALWLAAGCATGDSTMSDISWDPGLEASADGVAVEQEAAPPAQSHDAGSGIEYTPDASQTVDPPEGPADATGAEASHPDASSGSALGARDGGVESDANDAEVSGDSSTTNDMCPSTGPYAIEALIAAFNKPTLCPTGTCPSGQCCYSATIVALCVAR
jgi:hypothetical protein